MIQQEFGKVVGNMGPGASERILDWVGRKKIYGANFFLSAQIFFLQGAFS